MIAKLNATLCYNNNTKEKTHFTGNCKGPSQCALFGLCSNFQISVDKNLHVIQVFNQLQREDKTAYEL